MDGSNDTSAIEKELIYVMYVNSSGKPECRFFGLKDVVDVTATGVKTTLMQTFNEVGISDLSHKTVCLCVDGAAVNLGVRHGLAALLQEDMPWLVEIHCFNHRLELGVKDAFAKTNIDEISTMLENLYYVYKNSPKGLRELKSIGEIMEESINKPGKAQGTRWLQHKSRALHTLLSGYPVITAHLEAMAADSKVKPADQAWFKSYLKKLTSFKFVVHMLFFEALLNPLAALSCNLQGDTTDLLFATANIESLYLVLHQFRCCASDTTSELSRFLNSVKAPDGSWLMDEVSFRGVKLCYVQQSVATAFEAERGKYIDSLTQCLQGRFNNLQHQDVFKGIKLLNTSLWPSDHDGLQQFGQRELSLVIDHFRPLLLKNASIDSIFSEWEAFKVFWYHNLVSVRKDELWSTLLTKLKNKYPTPTLPL